MEWCMVNAVRASVYGLVASVCLLDASLERCGKPLVGIDYPGKGLSAERVILRGQLHEYERAALQNRATRVIMPALERLGLIESSAQRVPRIGLCVSGGGCRAFLDTLHCCRFLLECGFLDLVSHCATLSGSTWATIGWLYGEHSLAAYHERVAPKLIDHPFEHVNIPVLKDNILFTLAMRGSYTSVDLFGVFLAQLVGLAYDPCMFFGSEVPCVAVGDVPFPLLTVATVRDDGGYDPIILDPYMVTHVPSGTAVRSFAFGREWSDGTSVDHITPFLMPSILGMCGAAYAVSLCDLLRLYIRPQVPLIASILEYLVQQSDWLTAIAQYRISPAQVPSFIDEQQDMLLLDAGIQCNLPIHGLLVPERDIDCILIIDVSDDVPGRQLYLAESYAQELQLPFPALDALERIDDVWVVHGDKARHIPSLIYLYIPSPDFASTFKFSYSSDEISILKSGVYERLSRSMPHILKTVRLACRSIV